MANIVPLERGQPIVDQDGRMSQRTQIQNEQLSRLSILEGSGSPEGVVEAQIARLYMDTVGAAGSILYIKRDSDIAGNRTMGWILV